MLLDTDILIDVALDRDPHSREAAELLDRLQTRPKRAFVAWHTLSNFYCLVAPRRSGVGAREFIEELTRFVAVATTGTDAMQYAVRLPMADFEDAMQVAAARACGARHIITRNPGGLPAVTDSGPCAVGRPRHAVLSVEPGSSAPKTGVAPQTGFCHLPTMINALHLRSLRACGATCACTCCCTRFPWIRVC